MQSEIKTKIVKKVKESFFPSNNILHFLALYVYKATSQTLCRGEQDEYSDIEHIRVVRFANSIIRI